MAVWAELEVRGGQHAGGEANHMLYHVPNRRAAYAEFCRVLQPSGRLYAATISRDNMRELDASVSHVYPFRSQDRAAANPLVTGASARV